jgi:hypothetical protein
MPFLAWLALLLLPGLTVVAAGWAYVPLLSLSYWVISWGWLSPLGPGRESFLLASLVPFAGLASLRLLKPLGARRPGTPSLGVVGVAAGHVLPFFWWPAAPGLSAGFASACALLLTWHGGIPVSLRPLYPVDGFGHEGFGVAALAADLSLLSGLPAHRAELLAGLSADGLLVLALFTILKSRGSGGAAAALAALGGSLLAGVRLATGGSEGAVLGLALALAGAGLALRGSGWPSGLASSVFLGAGIAAEPAVGLAVGLGLLALLRRAGSGRRIAQVTALALLWALPVLLKTRSLRAVGDSLAENGGFLVAAVAVMAGTWFGSAAVARSRPRNVVAGSMAVAALCLGVWWRSSRVLVGPALLAEARGLANPRAPLTPLCRDDLVGRAWLPALTARPVRPLWAPAATLATLARGDESCSEPLVPALTFSHERKSPE